MGVKARADGDHDLVGISPKEHPDDNTLQVLVNSNANARVTFSYEPFAFSNLTFGVITIPAQGKPRHLLKNAFNLQANAVYVRRGSSTAIATPGEISDMGGEAARSGLERPVLVVEISDARAGERFGASHRFTSVLVDTSGFTFGGLEFGVLSTRDEYRKAARSYISDHNRFQRFDLLVRNTGQLTAEGVRVRLKIENDSVVLFKDEHELTPRPARFPGGFDFKIKPPGPRMPSVQRLQGRTEVIVEFEHIAPGDELETGVPIYVGTVQPRAIDVSGTIYARNVSPPMEFKLFFDLRVESRRVNDADLLLLRASEEED